MIIFRNKNNMSDANGIINVVIACAALFLFLKFNFTPFLLLPNNICSEVLSYGAFQMLSTKIGMQAIEPS